MPPPTPTDTPPRGPSLRRRLLGWLVAAALVAVLAALALAGAVWATTEVPDADDVAVPEISVVEFSDGTPIARIGAERRVLVPLERVSLPAQRAVLAAEDRTFYDNPGLSVRGILRAAWVNARSGEVQQGGSTITQQYARGAYLSQERTLERKLREVVIAAKLDRSYSKRDVLELYLNTVYFGRGAYGIEVAARTFFGKPAAELTAAEGAVLAAQLRSPARYDPASHPQRARDRWRYVLDGMEQSGWLDVPAGELAYPAVQPRRDRGNALGGPGGYLVQQAVEELEELGISEARVNVAGLRIRTTVDRQAQGHAVRAVQRVSGARPPDGVYRALVSVEPGTGRIRAEYAGHDYVSRPFNSVTQGRAQAGSSFKPYVLATALSKGIGLRTTFDGSSPQDFAGYEVRNFAEASYGELDLVEATARSVNTVYVPLGERAGLGDVADTAAALGITADMSEDRAYPSLSLGVTAVRPLDQAAAYAALAAGGVHAEPFLVERVTDSDGEVIHEAEVEAERVLPADVAADTTYALRQVVARGSGRAAALPVRPVAGKTGTTSGNTAAWFIGYTPRLATAVAIYSGRADTPVRGIAGVREVTGGSLPARTWKRYTAAAMTGQPARPFPPPAYVGEPEPEPIPPTPAPSTPTPSSPPADDAARADAPAPPEPGRRGDARGPRGQPERDPAPQAPPERPDPPAEEPPAPPPEQSPAPEPEPEPEDPEEPSGPVDVLPVPTLGPARSDTSTARTG